MGIGVTILKQAGSNRIFNLAYGAGLEYVAFEDFTCRGLHDVTQTQGGDSDRHFSVDGVAYLCWTRVESIYCRQMAITGGRNGEVHVENCRVRFCARDGINLTGSTSTIVTGNHLTAIADDSIAIHVTSAAGNPPPERHIVSSNIISDAYGIKMLGASKASISGNILSRVKGYAIYFADESTEGNNDLMAVDITNNVITDIINGNVFGGGNISVGIFVNSSTTSFQIPVIGGGTPDINKPESFTYLSNAANQNAGGQGINVVGNIVYGYTLPAVANYSTWGYGSAYTSTGPSDPVMTTYGSTGNISGMRLSGAILSINISGGNRFEALFHGILMDTSMTYLGEINIIGNTFRRIQDRGVNLNSTAQMYGRASILDNTFDMDPYFESSNRTGTVGKWAAGVLSTAIDSRNYKGATIRGNTFRNCWSSINSTAVEDTDLGGNTYYFEPTSAYTLSQFGHADNKGIRWPVGLESPNSTFVWENSDPSSATYGQELGRSQLATPLKPTTGYYIAQQFVKNSDNTVFGAGPDKYIIVGHQRMTTGNAHVLNTDWLEMRCQVGNATTAAISGTATITAANLATGTLVFTGGAGTQTLPTATNIGTQLGAVTTFDFIVDNTAGSGTCTIAVNTGIVAAVPIITGGATLTIANSATQGIGLFRLAFSSATAAILYRIG
jgi:hypothetical protein